MKRKLAIPLIGIILTMCLVCVAGLWLKNRTKSTIELLWPLTIAQRQCVSQITDKSNLVYVENQTDEDSIAIGYLVGYDYYVSVFNVGQSGYCNVEFQEKVWGCHEHVLPVYCDEPGYKLRPKRIRMVELTGSSPPEIYAWFDTPGPGRNSNAHHVFYTKQMDDSYRAVLTLRLCLGLSSVEIDTDSQKIVATDDLGCDMFHDRKEVIECSLLGGEAQCVEIRHDKW